MCHGLCAEIREQRGRVGSPFPQCEFGGSNSDHRAGQQALLLAEPSLWPMTTILQAGLARQTQDPGTLTCRQTLLMLHLLVCVSDSWWSYGSLGPATLLS